jgi:hypothetical protein
VQAKGRHEVAQRTGKICNGRVIGFSLLMWFGGESWTLVGGERA